MMSDSIKYIGEASLRYYRERQLGTNSRQGNALDDRGIERL